MKYLNKTCIALLTVFAMGSCSKDYFDVNDSQNNPISSTPELTLPVAQKASADLFSGGYASYNTLGNIWAYTWSSAGDYIFFVDEMQYNVTSSFRTGSFERAYNRPLANYDYIETFASEGDVSFSNYEAIAKIMKAFHFQYLVDLYGSVPYTEALKGSENITPAYDDGEFIYNAIYDELNNALDLITLGQTNEDVLPVGPEDIMLGGDMLLWAKFANTLKLKILLRQTETGNSFTDKYAEIDSNQYGLLGVNEDVFVNPGYAMDTDKQNPLFNAFGVDAAGTVTNNFKATTPTPYVLNKLDSYNDPRFDNLYAPAPDGSGFVGNEQNNQNAQAPKTDAVAKIGPGILKGPAQNAIIMQSAEALFLRAEAAQRMFISGDAKTLYESAIAESFEQLGELSDASIYYNQNINNVGWNASTNKIEAIITQKYIALDGTNGIEIWIEHKRTGFPADLPVAPDALQNTIPVRLLYPSSEVGTNPDNVPSQTTGDAFNSPVFWDK